MGRKPCPGNCYYEQGLCMSRRRAHVDTELLAEGMQKVLHMKKVLFVTTISGFLPQFEKNDVKILQEEGCEVHYASDFKNPVYTFDEQALRDQHIVLHQIDIAKNPVKIRKNCKAIHQIGKVIDEEQIDIVHCHNPMGGVDARIAAAVSKRKPYVIYTAHGFHFYKGAPVVNWMFFYTAEQFLAHFTDILVTINKEDFERAKKFRLKKNGSVFQIHSVGVDCNKFRPNKEIQGEKRKMLHVPEDAFHIVTAAELNGNKNQKVIIEAISRLPMKNIYYSICGKGPNEEALKTLIKEKNLSDRVRLLGFRTDMEEILQTADCFAFPSHREGLGVAAVEALLSDVPLIVSDNRGTREYAIDYVNAIICYASDADEYANAIQNLYRKDGLRKYMCTQCRKSAMQFTVGEVEKTMKVVYQKALESTDQ